MATVINTNIASLIAQRNLAKNTNSLTKSIERLSSGFRINRASDDAAGLAISENLKGQISGNTQAINNVQDGINMLQIAESGLSVVNENIQRIRELCVQAANDTNSSVERGAIMSEINARLADINRISKATEFNNIHLLDGQSKSVVLQIGAGSTLSTNTIDIASVLQKASTSANSLNIANLGSATAVTSSTWTGSVIRDYLDQLDDALSLVAKRRSNVGAYTNRLESALSNLYSLNENLQSAASRIKDVDVATETSNLTKYQILQQASASVLSQANTLPQIALKLLG